MADSEILACPKCGADDDWEEYGLATYLAKVSCLYPTGSDEFERVELWSETEYSPEEYWCGACHEGPFQLSQLVIAGAPQAL